MLWIADAMRIGRSPWQEKARRCHQDAFQSYQLLQRINCCFAQSLNGFNLFRFLFCFFLIKEILFDDDERMMDDENRKSDQCMDL